MHMSHYHAAARAWLAQQAGRFDAEIVPMDTRMLVKDVEGRIESLDMRSERDEGNRPSITLEGLASLKPVREGGCVITGNAGHLPDGASACVLMQHGEAERRGPTPPGMYRGPLADGCEPDEMGGLVFPVPRLGTQDKRLQVDGGAVSIGSPAA